VFVIITVVTVVNYIIIPEHLYILIMNVIIVIIVEVFVIITVVTVVNYIIISEHLYILIMLPFELIYELSQINMIIYYMLMVTKITEIVINQFDNYLAKIHENQNNNLVIKHFKLKKKINVFYDERLCYFVLEYEYFH